jgi:lipopolysaccharide biosynthesis glycosyltransferase
MENAIVIMFNDGYFRYAKVCIESIKENYPGHPAILAFYDGDDGDIISYLSAVDKLKICAYEPDYQQSIGLNTGILNLGVVNDYRVYFKYILWTDHFAEYNNVLHLDADTMVLKPLDHLFSTDGFFIVSNHYDDLFYADSFEDGTLQVQLEEDGLAIAQKDDMANAGVFMIPRQYRTPEHLAALLETTYRYNRHLKLADQSAISLWCHLNNIPISRQFQYNFQGYFYTGVLNEFDYTNIHIIHFAAGWKPESPLFQAVYQIATHFLDVYKKYNNYSSRTQETNAHKTEKTSHSI